MGILMESPMTTKKIQIGQEGLRAKIYDGPNLPFNPRTGSISIDEYMRRYRMIRSRATNKYLQQDLVAHLWAKRSLE